MAETGRTLDAKIEIAEVDGWEVTERKQNIAVMKKETWGSFKLHLLVVVLTGWWTFGVGNLLYALYRRRFKPKKLVLEGYSTQEELNGAQKQANEAQKRATEQAREQRLANKEAAKNTREAVRTVRKFF